jgi:hypothetical protein
LPKENVNPAVWQRAVAAATGSPLPPEDDTFVPAGSGFASAVPVVTGAPVVGADPGAFAPVDVEADVDADRFAGASADVDDPESQAESPRAATRAAAATAAVHRARDTDSPSDRTWWPGGDQYRRQRATALSLRQPGWATVPERVVTHRSGFRGTVVPTDRTRSRDPVFT